MKMFSKPVNVSLITVIQKMSNYKPQLNYTLWNTVVAHAFFPSRAPPFEHSRLLVLFFCIAGMALIVMMNVMKIIRQKD